MRIFFPLLLISLSATNAIAQDYAVPKTEWGVPNFHGVWKHATIMPFERSVELGEKRAYTEEEALVLEGAVQQKFEAANEPLSPDRAPPEVGEALPSLGNYDLFWREDAKFIPTIDGEFRTSAITDPPNGRMPERVAGFSERMSARPANRRGRNSDGPEGRGLGERCLLNGNFGSPVMRPSIYNSHLLFNQSPGYISITTEMAHDTRIIKITDDHNPAAQTQRKWMGSSIGRWEGDTLVVETTHFNNWQTLYGVPTENLTVVETFRRDSNNKMIYGFTVNDPTVFTAQFSGEYALSRINEEIYEYACHEGNYGMTGILGGARRLEQLGLEP
jgi:putative lipoic acid-binding regulatory protein